MRSTNRQPDSLWHPMAFFRPSTPILKIRSAWLFVGSTPATPANRHKAGYSVSKRHAGVARPTVGDDDPGDRFAQQRLKSPRASLEMDHEMGRRERRRRPEPTPGPGLLPAALVGVLRRGVAYRITGLVVRRDQGDAGLLLQRRDGSQRDRDLGGGLDQLANRSCDDMEPAAEVAHHRRQSRADDMGADLGSDRCLIERAASRTRPSVGPIFGDDGVQPGEFGDLVPGRLGVVGAKLNWQRRVAAGTDRRNRGDDCIDPVDGQAKSVMPAMPGLTSRRPPGGRLADRLGGIERVGRWRRGTLGRVALDLESEFFDLSLEEEDLSQSDIEFTTQLDTLRAGWKRGRFERKRGV